MAAMDFPSNPIDGQTSGNFIWSASTGAWKSKPSVSTVTIHSATVPTSANPGDVWYNTSNGLSFTYFDDGTSRQWVEMFSSAVPAVNTIMPAGTVVQTARSTAPDLWLLCQGQAVSRTTYSTLYAAIGTSYGSGDGSTTFNVPNLQGKVPVGKDSGTFASLGATGGAETVTLTSTQIPSHTHSGTTSNTGDHNHGVKTAQGHDDNNGLNGQGSAGQYLQESDVPRLDYYSYSTTTGAHTHTFTTDNGTGGNGSHNNLQPYLVLNYMIKV